MAVILMRHTRPVLDKSYCYGSLDIELAESFETDAKRATTSVPDVTRIVTSPLMRARQLAEYIATARRLNVTIDTRLVEMDFGSWEGRPWSDIPRNELDAWAADFLDARPHGGETVRVLRERCQAAVRDYAKQPGDTLAVCHAGVVRAIFSKGDTSQDFSKSIDYGQIIRWPE
ncbi:MAG: alpha-ribazole phosphatase family protein [Pseudomonadota bacterium]